MRCSPSSDIAIYSYSWDFGHSDAALNLRSTVTFTLASSIAETWLRVEQAGFCRIKREPLAARADWKQFLARLQPVIGGLS